MLNDDNSTSELSPNNQSEEVKEFEIRTVQEKERYKNSFFARMGTGLPSVLLFANFNNDTGSLDTQGEDSELPDILFRAL